MNNYNIYKRIIDILLSSLFILLLLPILALIYLVLRFSGERFPIYKQERVGLNNINFKIFKFATMDINSPNMLTGYITLREDPRVTKIGRFLRFTKINEFPQLFNILLGEMSFVGPRPMMPVGFRGYDDQYQKILVKVKPGLTGIGSILFRDEEEILSKDKNNPDKIYKEEILPIKGEFEKWYINNKSIFLDFKVMLLTSIIILYPKYNTSKHFKNIPSIK